MTACTLAKKGIHRKLLFGCKTLKCKTGWYQSLLQERMCWAELAHWSQLHSKSWWASSRTKKAVQHRGYRSAAFMLLSLAICVLSSGRLCMLLHNSHHSLSNGYKYIYFCVLMFGLSLILASKQTLGPEFKGICHASLLQPHPRDESEGHETGKADKNKSLINIRALNAKPFLFRLCLRALWEWQFFFLICAHIVEKLQANVLAIDHSTNRCWRCISKVTAWMQTFSTTVQWLIWLKDVKCSVTVCALFCSSTWNT